jgi:hypothetical protein
MGNCQTKKATRDAVASSPSSGQDEQKLHAAVPREAATNASDTEPTTPEKAEGPTSVVSQSPSQDAVVQSAVEDDHQGSSPRAPVETPDLLRSLQIMEQGVLLFLPVGMISNVIPRLNLLY